MAKRNLLRTSEYPYHIRGRTNNGEDFPTALRFIWKTLTGELFLQSLLHGMQVHSFVLMPNHYHLMATFPGRGIEHVMRDMISASTRIINSKSCRTGHVFSGSYRWSVIRDPQYFLQCYKYVIRNPVKAGLCKFPGSYSFSTYSRQIGSGHLSVPIFPPKHGLDIFIPKDFEVLDAWLSRPHRKEEAEAIRRGLRKREFDLSPDEVTRKKIIFEN